MFKPINNLEISLMKAANHPAYRPQFYRDLLEADIFAILAEQKIPDAPIVHLDKGDQLQIHSIHKGDKIWIPIFSSLLRLQQFIQLDKSYIKIKAKEFFSASRGAYLVLNPDLEYGKEFLPDEIESLLNGSMFNPVETITIQEDTKILVSQPNIYPKELIRELTEYFINKKSVSRAFWVQIKNQGSSEKPHFLIVIDSNADWERTISEVAMIASRFLPKDEFIDFMHLEEKGTSQSIIHSMKPFYERSFLKNIFS